MFLETPLKKFLLGQTKIVKVPRAVILLSFSALRVVLYFHMFFIPASSLIWIYKFKMETIYKHDLMSAEKSEEKIWSSHIEIV